MASSRVIFTITHNTQSRHQLLILVRFVIVCHFTMLQQLMSILPHKFARRPYCHLVIVGHFERRRSVALVWRAVRNQFCVNVAPGLEWGLAHTRDKPLVSPQAEQCVVKLQCDTQDCAHLMCQHQISLFGLQ